MLLATMIYLHPFRFTFRGMHRFPFYTLYYFHCLLSIFIYTQTTNAESTTMVSTTPPIPPPFSTTAIALSTPSSPVEHTSVHLSSHHHSRNPSHTPTHPWTPPIIYRPPPGSGNPTHIPEVQNQPGQHHHRLVRGQAAVAITFGVLGCLAIAIFTFGLLRCCYSYKKTPQRDRIAALLNRHRLQTEMEEIARQGGRLSPSQIPPPPPYVPKPPDYYPDIPGSGSDV